LFFLEERYFVAASEDEDDYWDVVLLLLELELEFELEIESLLEHEILDEATERMTVVEAVVVEACSCFLFAMLLVYKYSFDEEKRKELEKEEELPDEEDPVERLVLMRRYCCNKRRTRERRMIPRYLLHLLIGFSFGRVECY